MKQPIKIAFGSLLFIALLGYAGTLDYSEQIVYTMPQEAYEAIALKLGDGASNVAIAKEYMNNQEYYNSLSY